MKNRLVKSSAGQAPSADVRRKRSRDRRPEGNSGSTSNSSERPNYPRRAVTHIRPSRKPPRTCPPPKEERRGSRRQARNPVGSARLHARQPRLALPHLLSGGQLPIH